MRTTVLAFTVLLALPAPAHASPFDLKPYMVLIAGQSLDTVSTARFLQSGSCTEANINTFGSGTPSIRRIVITKAAVVGGIVAITAITQRHESKSVRVVGQIAAYFGGGVGAWDGIRNLRMCGR